MCRFAWMRGCGGCTLQHLSPEDQSAIDRTTSTIINKILHKPTVNLKKQTQSQEGHVYLKAIRHLFHLDD